VELTSPTNWAKASFGDARLGDTRRTRRLVELAAALARRAGSSIPAACEGNPAAVEGAYRFARNDAIEPGGIAEAGFEATAALVKKGKHTVLLAPEDSTVLSYEHDVDDLGDVGGPPSTATQGIWAHSAILVDPLAERTLGLVAQHRWVRKPEEYGKRHQRKELPYEEKESFKWQRTAEGMRRRLGTEVMARVVGVCDREGDVYPYLANKLEHSERFIVRAEWNRNVTEQENVDHLRDVLKAVPVLGNAEVELPQRGGRAERKAKLRLTSATVELRRPKSLEVKYPSTLEVNAVLAEELKPPKGEAALSWMLLTTEPVESLADVENVLEWYRMRWRIEVFHKAWKTGAGVERQRLQTAENLERIAVVLAFVAIRLIQLRELFEEGAEVGCDQLLDKETWTLLWVCVEKKKPPRTAPPAEWAYRALARFAGWTDTKRTGKVGWDTLWKGWSRLQERYEGLQAYKRMQSFN
jgi:Transposase DNA-binding/Transposase DDE domain